MAYPFPEGDVQRQTSGAEIKITPSLKVVNDIGAEAVAHEGEVVPLRLQSDGQESPWAVPKGHGWGSSDDVRRRELEGRARPHSPAAAAAPYLDKGNKHF